jgi:hypothetical protein
MSGYFFYMRIAIYRNFTHDFGLHSGYAIFGSPDTDQKVIFGSPGPDQYAIFDCTYQDQSIPRRYDSLSKNKHKNKKQFTIQEF